MTTVIINNEPQYLEVGPPGVFVPLAEVNALEKQMTAERDALREQLFKATKDLKRMVRDWRVVAAGDYCRIYNHGMGQGLETAADNLEKYVNDKIQGEQE